MAKTTIRSGDIEALRNKAKLNGRPMISNMVRDEKGNQIFHKVDKHGRVRITEVYNPNG